MQVDLSDNISTTMSKNVKDVPRPSTLQEANNYIKFLTTTHEQEKLKWKEVFRKQTDHIKKLEINRKKELEFLSQELHKYESNLAIRSENVAQELEKKDNIIRQQAEIIKDLNIKLSKLDNDRYIKETIDFIVPEITILPVDSNSDSGIAMDHEEGSITSESATPTKNEIKSRKCSRRFADSISFLRRVDFSPMKYKPAVRDTKGKKSETKKNLDVPTTKKVFGRRRSKERPMSDDDRSSFTETVLSDNSSTTDSLMLRPKKINDSMTNHFSDDGSEDTSEEIFDRVMTRSSIRRSVKANPKYKKINRTKSKLLEQVKNNIVA